MAMPTNSPTRLALLAASLVLAGCAADQREGPEERPPAATASLLAVATDRYLEPYLETGNFSGSILVARGGTVLLARGYGWADLEHSVANTPRTVFHIASVSRVVTATAALLLVEDGLLALEDPLSRHLPGFPNGERITVHHLLTLSAGFPNVNSLPGYDEWSLSPQTPASLTARFRDLPLDFEPGERSVHSNSNYNVLALLIEELSGKRFGEFLDQRIFAPLGMTATAHDDDPARIVPHRARGLIPTGVAGFVNAPFLHWSVKTGNGSLYSTVEDLYRYDRALAEGRLLPPESVAATFAEHFPNNGYGWVVRERFGDRELYINGRSPGFGSYLGRLEEQDLTVVVLGNLYNSLPTDIARGLMALALGEEPEPVRFGGQPLAAELLAELTGDYQFGDDFYAPNARYSITAEGGHLLADGDWLMPAGDLAFVHRIYGSDLLFERDSSGRVVALVWDEFRGERVAAD